MRSYFKENIEKKIALKKCEVIKFIDRNKEQFTDVSWVRVKTFIFNEYRMKH